MCLRTNKSNSFFGAITSFQGVKSPKKLLLQKQLQGSQSTIFKKNFLCCLPLNMEKLFQKSGRVHRLEPTVRAGLSEPFHVLTVGGKANNAPQHSPSAELLVLTTGTIPSWATMTCPGDIPVSSGLAFVSNIHFKQTHQFEFGSLQLLPWSLAIACLRVCSEQRSHLNTWFTL